MCLITTQKEPLIATEDMIVYKSFSRKLLSPFMDFQYERNKLYETVIEEDENWSCFDDKDMKYLDTFHYGWRNGTNQNLKCLGSGFHSALSQERLGDIWGGETKLKCIIPKGSLYYTEPTGLVVSNKIQIP